MKLGREGQKLAGEFTQELAALDQKDEHERESDLHDDADDDHDPGRNAEQKVQRGAEEETADAQGDDRQRVQGETHEDRYGGDAAGDSAGMHHDVSGGGLTAGRRRRDRRKVYVCRCVGIVGE